MKKLDGLALLVCINSSGLTFIALCLYDVISILDGLHKWTWLLFNLPLQPGYIIN